MILYHVKGVTTAQLFDLNTDPAELHNLAQDKKHTAKLKEMKILLAQEMNAAGDDLDINQADWKKVQN